MKRKMRKKPVLRLERLEAKLVVEEMLCLRVSEPHILTALQKQYDIGTFAAKAILDEATTDMVIAVDEARPNRRAQMIASLDRQYERCVAAGKEQAALGAQRLIAQIEGTTQPVKVEIEHTGSVPNAFTEGRSIEECDYYSVHGHFPDEAPISNDEPAAPPAREFPLH